MVRICSATASPVAFTGSLDGVVRGWDLRSGQVIKEFHGHSSNILDLALLRYQRHLKLVFRYHVRHAYHNRDEKAILSAAADNTVKIFTP